MDYERRRVRWYWVTLFVIYSMVTIYAILIGNPFLYSHKEFKREIQNSLEQKSEPIPSVGSQLPLTDNLGDVESYFPRLNPEMNADGPNDLTFGKNFVEKLSAPLKTSDEDFAPSLWSMDARGVVLGGDNEAAAFDLDGNKQWEFRFIGSRNKKLCDVLTDHGLAYLIQTNGEIAAINRSSGQLQWHLKLLEEVVGPSLVSAGRLLIPLKSKSTDLKNPRPSFHWIVIQRNTGEIRSLSKIFEAKPGFQLSQAPDLGAWIISYDNKVTAIDSDKLELLWTQTMTDPLRGPVTVVGHGLFASTLAGKVIKLDGSKKGRLEWEAEVERPPVSAPTYLPIMTKLSVIDDQGGLQLIDAKVGKSLWRFNIENHNILRDTWSFRLRGSVIQETGMDWLYRGWSVWAPCSKNRFCIYNPAKGQLINRVPLSGSLVSFPMIKDKDLYFLVNQGKNLALSRVEMERQFGSKDGPATQTNPPGTAETH